MGVRSICLKTTERRKQRGAKREAISSDKVFPLLSFSGGLSAHFVIPGRPRWRLTDTATNPHSIQRRTKTTKAKSNSRRENTIITARTSPQSTPTIQPVGVQQSLANKVNFAGVQRELESDRLQRMFREEAMHCCQLPLKFILTHHLHFHNEQLITLISSMFQFTCWPIIHEDVQI